MSLRTLMQAGPVKVNELFAKLAETSDGAVKTREKLFAELRTELEAYTKRDWGEFFERWVYGKGLTDWSVERVSIEPRSGPRSRTRYTATAVVKQSREFTEPTMVAFSRTGAAGWCA